MGKAEILPRNQTLKNPLSDHRQIAKCLVSDNVIVMDTFHQKMGSLR